jgi:rubrerythrin
VGYFLAYFISLGKLRVNSICVYVFEKVGCVGCLIFGMSVEYCNLGATLVDKQSAACAEWKHALHAMMIAQAETCVLFERLAESTHNANARRTLADMAAESRALVHELLSLLEECP